MAYDNHKNFAYSTVATAPSPATSGTSITVNTGDGALFPAAPFNVVIWPSGQQPTAANAEVARVTAVSTDTFTITRAQESSSARTVVTGDQIAAAVTAKLLTDLETNKVENPMTTSGDIIYGGASGAPTRLGGGTSGYVLTSNGPTAAPSWQAASGGGGSSASTEEVFADMGGKGTRFLDQVNFAGSGTAAWDSDEQSVVFRTGATSSSKVYGQLYLSASRLTGLTGSGNTYRQVWTTADFNTSGSGLVFCGWNAGAISASPAWTYSAGVRRTWVSGTVTTEAISGGTGAVTAVSFTPTNNTSSANQFTIYKTATGFKFYDKQTLVATITTNIANFDTGNVGTFYVSNQTNTSNMAGAVFNFNFWRSAA